MTFSHSECKGSANREKCKINRIYFHFRDAAYLRDKVSKVRLSEKKTKGKTYFSFRKRAIFRNFSYLCTRKASRAVIFGWTRQPSNWSHGGQYDAEAKFINFKNIPSYATTHLLHSFCSALRRHADSPVSNRFQRPGAKPRLVLHASLPRPGTPRRVPPPRHRYHLRLRWTRYFLRPSSKIRITQQQVNYHRVTLIQSTPPLPSALGKGGVFIVDLMKYTLDCASDKFFKEQASLKL